MIYNLNKVKSVWLTCSKSADRHPKFEKMLNKLGVQAEKFDGEITAPYTVGVAKAHLNALQTAQHILILEDDATDTPDFKMEFEAPDDADAIYLGSSLFGMLKGQTTYNGVIAADYSQDYLRVFNMLSMHAVLYLSYRYKNHVKKLLTEFIQNPQGGCDDNIARTMYKFNIYVRKDPFFFQNDGHSEYATTTPITPIIV